MTPSKRWVLSCGEDGSCAVWRAAGGVVRTAPSRRWTIDCKSADRVVHSYVEQPKEEGGVCPRPQVSRGRAVPRSGTGGGGVGLCRGCWLFRIPARSHRVPAGASPPRRPRRHFSRLHRRTPLPVCFWLRRVRIWAQYGRGCEGLLEYKGPLDTLAISPDVRYAASGAQDSTLVLWPLGEGGELSRRGGRYGRACGRADGLALSSQQRRRRLCRRRCSSNTTTTTAATTTSSASGSAPRLQSSDRCLLRSSRI